MIIAIHQPNYLPYLGFFDKMMKSDVFVIYDDAQFNKEDFHNRNKIRIYQGWKWLTVPVEKKLVPINQIKIRNELKNKGLNWSDEHLRLIEDNYRDTQYYCKYKEELKTIYTSDLGKIIDLNMQLIHFLRHAFNINTKLIFSSDLDLSSKGTQRLVEIVKTLDGDIYLSGEGGKNYLDVSLFTNKGIRVEFQKFNHPIYRQRYEGFILNLSAIDALFNIGKFPVETNMLK